MENIIVEIALSTTGVTADFMLPTHVSVASLLVELVKLVEQVHQELTFGEEPPLLCSVADRRILPHNLTLAQCGIRDSDQLLLI